MPLLEAALILAGSVVAAPQTPVQEVDPGRAARSAAYRYESLLRRRTPYVFGSVGGRCDEIIGRFCFRFGDDGTPEPPPEPEHPDVKEARRRAVQAYRRWLSSDPTRPEAAGGLIRYLIEDGRPGEAVSLARAHAWAAPGSESLLLLGLAYHYTGDFVASESAFDSARAAASASTREVWGDVGVLLEPGERARYEDLDRDARRAYNRRFWAFSDPSLLVPGNERRSAHYARHAWATILAEAPRARGMLSWGGDHEEIVVRYGLPRSRERIRPSTFQLRPELSVVEYYDPHAVSFVPAALLSDGVPGVPAPGDRPELERDTVRSSYAPVTHHRVRGLTGQATRIPTAQGWLLRVDALLPPDSGAPGVPRAPRGLLTVLDTLGREVSRSAASVLVGADSQTVVRVQTDVPPGPHVYQIEVVDDSTGLAGRGRYRIDVPGRSRDFPALSDPLVAAPFDGEAAVAREALDPIPGRVLPTGGRVLVWAEARGLRRVAGTARYAVEWWLEPADPGSLVGRALRWVGRSLGLVGDAEAVRVRWQAASEASDPVPISFTLDLGGAEAGLYRLVLRVRDEISGRAVTSYREVRLDPRAPTGFVRGRD